jgi:hypothetical protein
MMILIFFGYIIAKMTDEQIRSGTDEQDQDKIHSTTSTKDSL